MRISLFAVAASALVGSTVSAKEHRRHNHEAFHKMVARGGYVAAMSSGAGPTAPANSCVCTTYTTTMTGPGTLIQPPQPSTSTVVISTATVIPAPYKPVPTPQVTVCPTPGVYTIPATTVTLNQTTTVCAATSTTLPPGTHTVGGVTTVVLTSTTVVCPYASVETSQGVVTSKIYTTTYVCPSAGTYTIAPTTVTPSVSTVMVYPVPATYTPGTYTQPAVVVTVTVTSQVVVCPYAAPTLPPQPYTPAASTPAYVAAPAPTQGTKPGSNGAWSMTYSPYTNEGGCKGPSEVASDIADIASKGFSSVRVYSTDCNGLQNVGQACSAHGLKMSIGIFIDDKGINGAKPQVDAIISWGQWSLVELIVIGNEALFNQHCSVQELHDFISSCKASFQAAGYSGPCTTTEPLNILQESGSALCDVIDAIGANIHPFFNPTISADKAGDFVANQYGIVKGICPGKPAYILETGWPNAGSCNGAACPGQSEQQTAIKDIIAKVGPSAVIFSYTNDAWKQPGPFGVEPHFGCASVFA